MGVDEGDKGLVGVWVKKDCEVDDVGEVVVR